MIKKTFLVLSIFAIIYISSILILPNFDIENYQIIRIVGELLTIPIILFVIFSTVFSILKIVNKHNEYRSVLLVNAISIILIVMMLT